jgi:hypothetical protein
MISLFNADGYHPETDYSVISVTSSSITGATTLAGFAGLAALAGFAFRAAKDFTGLLANLLADGFSVI